MALSFSGPDWEGLENPRHLEGSTRLLRQEERHDRGASLAPYEPKESMAPRGPRVRLFSQRYPQGVLKRHGGCQAGQGA